MTRDVNCTIVNNTPSTINWNGDALTTTLSHGEADDGPYNIPGNTGPDGALAFKLKKKTGFDGVTGYIGYNLPDGSTLYLMFNNPHDHSGPSYTGNQWFYAAIQPPAGGYSTYYTQVNGAGINPVDPEGSDTLDVTVTLNQQPVTDYQGLSLTDNQNSAYQFICNINNQNPNGAFVLFGMTNDSNSVSGVGSPPVKQGNPPAVAETLPTDKQVLAIQANGGWTIIPESPKNPQQIDLHTTQGQATYLTPGGYLLIISWNIQPYANPVVSIGGTYPNPPAVGDPTISGDGNTFSYTWTFE